MSGSSALVVQYFEGHRAISGRRREIPFPASALPSTDDLLSIQPEHHAVVGFRFKPHGTSGGHSDAAQPDAAVASMCGSRIVIELRRKLDARRPPQRWFVKANADEASFLRWQRQHCRQQQ